MSRRRETLDDWLKAALTEANKPAQVRRDMWSGVDAESIRDFIACITEAGAACLFGTTSDGGAMSVLIMHNDAKHRLYETDSDVMTQMLSSWAGKARIDQNNAK
jgi:hypothetical protein